MKKSTHPRKARRDFLSMKEQTVKDSTHRAYDVVTSNFINFLEANGITDTENINGFTIEQWKLKRKEDDGVAPATLHNNVKHLRVFIKYLESSEMVGVGLYDKVEVPNITDEQRRSDDTISPSKMEEITDHLATYEYATRLHAVSVVLWHTGCRVSGAIALDLRDFQPEEQLLCFRSRPSTGTGLKNRKKSERNVTINEDVIAVLNDYVKGRREQVTDEYGREPLFTTSNGRMGRQRAYKDFTGISRPCEIRGNCPHDREIQECEAAKKRYAFKCPSSDSLHPIRRGAITYHLNQDWPMEKVSERCNVSIEVLEKHYDARTHEDKRESRKKFIDNL